MSAPTIEIHGMFGKPKRYTREQYATEWVSHCGQLFNVTVTREDHTTVQGITDTIKEMAGRRWDEIYERENSHV